MAKVKYYALLTYCQLQYLLCMIFIIVFDLATSSVISLRWKRLKPEKFINCASDTDTECIEVAKVKYYALLTYC